MTYKTEQEEFWAGEFGTEYISRNNSKRLLSANLAFFSKILSNVQKPHSILEFGANIGMNLEALKLLLSECQMHAIEINKDAAFQLKSLIGESNVYNTSILDFEIKKQFDLVLIKGVLIHINPGQLQLVYSKLYDSSCRYILICEYYNPSPVSISYRGHSERLFKRDFAGEMMDRYPDLKLADYGFVYRRDNNFPQDDTTWFLLEK